MTAAGHLRGAPPKPRSLRRAAALAFVPLIVAVAAAGTCQFVLARTVHVDVRRLFEESRELSLVRGLLDELRGIQQWVEAAPESTRDSHPLIHDDIRLHHAAARAAFARFTIADDPSSPAHDADEDALLASVRAGLDALDRGMQTAATAGDLAPALTEAVLATATLDATIDREARAIGTELDRRSSEMAWFLLALGAVVAGTVAVLAWWLARAVLLPVRELQRAAVRLGGGELTAPIPAGGPGELGDLARTLATMAGRVRDHRTQLEERVAQRSREALRSARLAQLGTLAAGIAHEVNNPLASIVAGTEGLLRELDEAHAEPTPGFRDYLKIVHREALRVRDITARLLRFARQDGPRQEVVHLATEAREVTALFAHQLQTAGVRLDLAIDGDGPALVGDAAEWRQVLFNLLRNALDASPRGGTIRLRICLTLDGDVELTIADDGPGVPAELHDRIFEPLFTTKAPGQGTGLGLAIVHRIVEAHGGRISVGGRPDGRHGAQFTITVPAAAVPPAAITRADQA